MVVQSPGERQNREFQDAGELGPAAWTLRILHSASGRPGLGRRRGAERDNRQRERAPRGARPARQHHRQPAHAAEQPDLFFYNEQGRTEVDIVIDTGSRLVAVEVKSGQTVVPEFFKGLDRLAAALGGNDTVERVLVHGGASSHVQQGTRVVPWNAVAAQDWGL